MLRASSRLCALVALSLVAPSCAFVTDFDAYYVTPDGGGTSTEYDAFVDALATAVCARAIACEGKSTAASIHQMACGHVSGAPETSLFEHFLEVRGPHGASDFDAARADACLAAVAPEGCPNHVLPVACAFLREGATSDGDDCVVDIDCTSGRCEGAPLTCGARVCAALGVADGACSDRWDCADGLVCASGICRTPLAIGAACAADTDCVAGAWCDDIDGTGACAARPDLEGDACVVHGGQDPCSAGLYCVAGTCARGGELSSSCSETMPCGPGLRCISNVCRSIVLAGATCVTGNDCPQHFDCVSSVCEARPVLGQACGAGRPCALGVCADGTCDLPRLSTTCTASSFDFVPLCDGFCDLSLSPSPCRALKVDGAGCALDGECQSGACIGGTCDTCD